MMIVKFAFFLCVLPIFSAHPAAPSPLQEGQQNLSIAQAVVSKFLYNVTDEHLLESSNKTIAAMVDIAVGTANTTSEGPRASVMRISNTTNFRRTGRIRSSTSEAGAFKSSIDAKWVSYPFEEGLKDFSVTARENAECQRQVDSYRLHLRNQTLWAVQLRESTQRYPVALLGGTAYQMGSFDECVKIRYQNIRGKYCLANLNYALKPAYRSKYHIAGENDFNDFNYAASVWDAIEKMRNNPTRLSRTNIYWAFCMPASCTNEDLELSLNNSLVPVFDKYNITLTAKVDDIYCTTSDPLPYTTGFYVTLSIMALLLLTNVFSTFVDLYDYLRGKYSHNTSGSREFIAAFSIYRNLYNLGIYNKDSQVKIASAIKVLMMVLVIYGHTLLYLLGYPHFNPQHMEDRVYSRGADIALVNTNIVDVFFAVSGFITFYYGFRPMKVGGIVYLILSIIIRYVRLMPIFALIMAYVTFILPYTSDGPIWKAKILAEVGNCYENWWSNLLLINNFKNVSNQCVLISWYVTDDILLCILGSILLYVIVKKPKFGLLLTVATFLGSIAITYTITYVNRYGGLIKLYMAFLEEPRRSIEFDRLYVALYSRAGPYLVGYFFAYLTIKLQERKYKFPLKVLIIGSSLAGLIGEGSQYYGIVFYQYGRPYYRIENALYSCLHRVLFACLFSWFLMIYLTTGFGILNHVVNHRLWTVLGRITYSVFLVNILNLITFTASTRTPWFASYKFIMFVVFGDILTTYMFGFLFYLYAEAPLCSLSKLLQKTMAKLFEKEIAKATEKALEKEKPIDNR